MPILHTPPKMHLRIPPGNLPRIPPEISSDISSMIFPAIASRISPGITSGVFTDLLSEIYSEIPLEITSGIPPFISHMIPLGISRGVSSPDVLLRIQFGFPRDFFQWFLTKFFYGFPSHYPVSKIQFAISSRLGDFFRKTSTDIYSYIDFFFS